jgi:hypothetical protein
MSAAFSIGHIDQFIVALCRMHFSVGTGELGWIMLNQGFLGPLSFLDDQRPVSCPDKTSRCAA